MKKYIIGGLIAAGIFYYGMCNDAERLAVKGIVKRSYKHSKETIERFLDKQDYKSYNPNADDYYQPELNDNIHKELKGKKMKLRVRNSTPLESIV